MNRASYGTAGAKVTPEQRLACLEESVEVEYSADAVALLYGYKSGEEPPGVIPAPTDDWRPIGLSLAKNREWCTDDRWRCAT